MSTITPSPATTFTLADSMRRLGTESAFVVLARARQLEAEGRDIIHLEIGEPDFDTPEHVKDAGIASIRKNRTHYTPAQGIADLRDAVVAHIAKSRGVEVKRENVLISPGAKPMIAMTLMALLNPGDEVVIPDPAYPAYRSIVTYVGAIPVSVPLLEHKGFRLELDALEAAITPRTKMIIINSPHNPTGGILTKEDVDGIADIARRRDLLVMTDEIYNRHCYDAEFVSYYGRCGMPERTILIDGWSKAWAMTGWRLGFGVMPAYIADAVGALLLNTVSCTTTFVQDAGIAALTGPDAPVKAMRDEFLRRRNLLVDGLNKIPGISCQLPGGAFYVFPNISAIDGDDIKVANHLLNDGGVAALGGSTFGPNGKGFLRFSYAASDEHLRQALARVSASLGRLRRS
jgi:aspartate aminotransferase